MEGRTQVSADVVPCRLCFGKFGNHPWRACPARCETCDGYGHMLGPNHPIGHIDTHPHPHVFRDLLKDSLCANCNGSGLLPQREEELKQYRKQLAELISINVT